MNDNDEIKLDTFGALADRGHGIVIYCRKCEEHRKLDMSKMPREASIVKRKYRCKTCGELGQMTLSIGND